MDGITLSNLRAGHVFNVLVREVFSRELADRSEKLVEDVKSVMEQTVGSLCEHFCAAYPILLNDLNTTLVEEFMDTKQRATKVVVANVIEAEQE